ncbi:hypothetical protein O9929_23340 [Vibrio lentus]|nr:hypothetical protein [Vibrio lentus]
MFAFQVACMEPPIKVPVDVPVQRFIVTNKPVSHNSGDWFHHSLSHKACMVRTKNTRVVSPLEFQGQDAPSGTLNTSPVVRRPCAVRRLETMFSVVSPLVNQQLPPTAFMYWDARTFGQFKPCQTGCHYVIYAFIPSQHVR